MYEQMFLHTPLACSHTHTHMYSNEMKNKNAEDEMKSNEILSRLCRVRTKGRRRIKSTTNIEKDLNKKTRPENTQNI